MERVCDFCGLKAFTENAQTDEHGRVSIDPTAIPTVLSMNIKIDPAVVFGKDFEVSETTYSVCTQCILTFFQKRDL